MTNDTTTAKTTAPRRLRWTFDADRIWTALALTTKPCAVYTIERTVGPGPAGNTIVFELFHLSTETSKPEKLGNEFTLSDAQDRAERHRAGPLSPVWSSTLGRWRLR